MPKAAEAAQPEYDFVSERHRPFRPRNCPVWRRRLFEPEDLVRVVVGEENKQIAHRLHRRALAEASQYFASLPSSTETITLLEPEVNDHLTFEAFRHFIYCGDYEHENNVFKSILLHAKVYVLAGQLHAEPLKELACRKQEHDLYRGLTLPEFGLPREEEPQRDRYVFTETYRLIEGNELENLCQAIELVYKYMPEIKWASVLKLDDSADDQTAPEGVEPRVWQNTPLPLRKLPWDQMRDQLACYCSIHVNNLIRHKPFQRVLTTNREFLAHLRAYLLISNGSNQKQFRWFRTFHRQRLPAG